jgi:thymidine phosphorylase
MLLHKKIGDTVHKGEPLFTIFAERSINLQRALDRLEGLTVMGVGDRMEMLIHEVAQRPVTKRSFALDR